MSVVSHAVANIVKRVLVVLLLYAIGQRHASTTHFAWLSVCVLGLAIYVRDKVQRLNGNGGVTKERTGQYTNQFWVKLWNVLLEYSNDVKMITSVILKLINEIPLLE